MSASARTALKLFTLGTGTAFPQADRGPTCHLVQVGNLRVAVDLGSGALQKLAAVGAFPLNLDAVLLTHAHLDHISDIIPLLFALNVPGYTRTKPLAIYASAETLTILHRVRDAWGDWLDANPDFVTFHPLATGDELTLGGTDDALKVHVGTVEHTASSIGFRLTGPSGETLAIPGDSGPCQGLVELCRDVDLAVVECGMPDVFPLESHMTPGRLTALAQDSGLRALAVVHRYPLALSDDLVADLRDAIAVPVHVPDDGAEFTVSSAHARPE